MDRGAGGDKVDTHFWRGKGRHSFQNRHTSRAGERAYEPKTKSLGAMMEKNLSTGVEINLKLWREIFLIPIGRIPLPIPIGY